MATKLPSTNLKYYDRRYDATPAGKAAKKELSAAQEKLDKYGPFVFSQGDSLANTIKGIQDYGDFSFDLDSDALYQQYTDQYINQGRLAMENAMGQAAAMTGGYGNSYAQSVGQQAYDARMDELNQIGLDLYDKALERYQLGKEDLYNQYSMLSDVHDREYGIYTDEYGRLLDMHGLASDNYYRGADVYAADMDRKNAAIDKSNSEKWERHYADVAEEERNYAREQNELDRIDNNAKLYVESGGKAGYYNGNLSEAQVKELQTLLGVTANGKWGSESTKEAGNLTAEEAWEAYQNGTLGKSGLTYNEIEAEIKDYIAAGADYNDIIGYLDAALESEEISTEEYKKLVDLYAIPVF